MKAIVYTKYGTPDVLQLKEVEKPIPKDDEVLIKVHAASVNDWDWGLLCGSPLINRLEVGLFKPKKVQILGSDISGKIEAVGKKIKSFKPGNEVYGDLTGKWGGFAEYVCAQEKSLALKPKGMTFEEAAAIPQAGMLAVQGLLDKGQIDKYIKNNKNKLKLLINGAGGGVGTFGIQIAKLYNVEVTGVDSSEKLEMMSSLGFDHVIDYTKDDFTKKMQKYDIILDNKISRSIFEYFRSLYPKGIYITTGGSMSRFFETILYLPIISLFSRKKVRIVLLKPNKYLNYMNKLFEAGNIKPVIDGPYKLSEVPKVLKYFGDGKHKGKIVIKVV